MRAPNILRAKNDKRKSKVCRRSSSLRVVISFAPVCFIYLETWQHNYHSIYCDEKYGIELVHFYLLLIWCDLEIYWRQWEGIAWLWCLTLVALVLIKSGIVWLWRSGAPRRSRVGTELCAKGQLIICGMYWMYQLLGAHACHMDPYGAIGYCLWSP
jgi:hypothetical protein